MTVIDCKQGTYDWFQARCGKVTASEVANVLSFLKRGEKKGGETQARANYKAQIVAEILTGNPDMEGYVSSYMKFGTENEPFARAAYEMKTGNEVDLVGFVEHATISRFGASPDGLIGSDGGLELKCPKTETHLRWLVAGVVPEEHEPQMVSGMSCTGRSWWDFASYDPRLPPGLRLFHMRLPRNEERIAEIENGVVQFNAEIDEVIEHLKAIAGVDLTHPAQPTQPPSECLITDEDIQWALNRK